MRSGFLIPVSSYEKENKRFWFCVYSVRHFILMIKDFCPFIIFVSWLNQACINNVNVDCFCQENSDFMYFTNYICVYKLKAFIIFFVYQYMSIALTGVHVWGHISSYKSDCFFALSITEYNTVYKPCFIVRGAVEHLTSYHLQKVQLTDLAKCIR
jgi:hypothetical protein